MRMRDGMVSVLLMTAFPVCLAVGVETVAVQAQTNQPEPGGEYFLQPKDVSLGIPSLT